jgi:hypothetical protein
MEWRFGTASHFVTVMAEGVAARSQVQRVAPTAPRGVVVDFVSVQTIVAVIPDQPSNGICWRANKVNFAESGSHFLESSSRL